LAWIDLEDQRATTAKLLPALFDHALAVEGR
jgi:hypothetical protein